MVKCRDLNRIDLAKYPYSPKRKYTTRKNVIALDTETENGYAFIIGVQSVNDKSIYRIKSFDDFLKVMVKYSTRNLFFFYNITYDYQALIKYLSDKAIMFLAKYEYYETQEYQINYIPNKCLTIYIKKTEKTYRIFDLAQFYNHTKLDDVGYAELGINKLSLSNEGIDIAQLSVKRYDTDNEYKSIINKYLYRDIEITYLIGEKLIDLSIETLDLYPRWLYSQASISQQKTLELLRRKHLPVDDSIIQIALNCYNGGRFETMQRGFFENAKIIDINSAYPNQMYKLPDLDSGKWIKDKSYHSNSLISMFHISVKLSHNDLLISPLKYQDKKKLYYPIGKFKSMYINKSEYDIIHEYTPNIKILHAVHYFNDYPEQPFAFIKKYYDKRVYMKKTKTGNERMIKICINGAYGKTIQLIPVFEDIIIPDDLVKQSIAKYNNEIDDIYIDDLGQLKFRIKSKFQAGNLFNPVYANEITANTRCQLFNACKDYQDDVIGFATDSISYIGNRIKVKIDKYKLGYWGYEMKNERLLCLGSGVYHRFDINKSKLRGFDTKYNLYNLLKENKLSDEITINLKKLVKLKYLNKLKDYKDMKYQNDKDKFKNLNLFTYMPKSININFDNKRLWDRDFVNCEDVLNNNIQSKPIFERV